MAIPRPAGVYNFIDPNNSYSGGVFTFANLLSNNAVVSAWHKNTADPASNITWNSTDGLTTNEKAGLRIQPGDFSVGGSFTFEIVFKFNPTVTHGQAIFMIGDHDEESCIKLNRLAFNNGLQGIIRDKKQGVGMGVCRIEMQDENDALQGTATDFLHLVWVHNDTSISDSKFYINGQPQPVTFDIQDYSSLPDIVRTAHYIGTTSQYDAGNETIKYIKVWNEVVDPTSLYNNYLNPVVVATGAPCSIIPNKKSFF